MTAVSIPKQRHFEGKDKEGKSKLKKSCVGKGRACGRGGVDEGEDGQDKV